MITIIDKTKPLPPIMVRAPIPETFKTTLEEQKYWEEEKKRSIEGYNDLPGTLYHYIQHQLIQNRYTGEVFHPICRDVDVIIFNEIERAKKEGQNIFFSKGRGVGLSVIGGALCNYHMKFYPGSNTFVTSVSAEHVAAFFGEKIMPVYTNYHPSLQPTLLSKSETTKAAAIKVAVGYKDEYGNDKYGESKITLKETSQTPKSPNAFSGKGAIFGFFDELPLHQRWRALLKSSEYCFIERATGNRIGTLMAGGTFEETLTNAQISLFNEFLNEANIWKFNHVFIPYWMGMHMVNGHSNKEKADEEWEKEHDARLKSKDTSLARAWRLNNPRSIDDILELAGGARFSETINNLIKEQDKYLEKIESGDKENNIRPQELYVSVKLIDTITRGDKTEPIHVEPSNDSHLIMFEAPKAGINYFATIDGTGTGIKSGNIDGSDWCTYIMKEFDPSDGGWCPVMKWKKRPDDPPSAVKFSLLMCQYYDKYGGFKKIWAEGNRGMESAYDLLVNKGFERFISYKKNVEKGTTLGTLTPWQYVVDREYMVNRASVFLEKHIGSIKDRALLRSMLEPIDNNVDDFDSWCMMFIGYRGIDDEREPPKPAMRNYGKLVRNSSGIWVREFKMELVRDANGNVVDEKGNIIDDTNFRKPKM